MRYLTVVILLLISSKGPKIHNAAFVSACKVLRSLANPKRNIGTPGDGLTDACELPKVDTGK